MKKVFLVMFVLMLFFSTVVEAASNGDVYYRYAYRNYDTSMKYKISDGSLMELFVFHPEGEIDQFLQVTKCDIFIFIPWNCQGLSMYVEQAWYPEDQEWPALFWDDISAKVTIRTEIPYYWKTFFDNIVYTPVSGPQNGLGPLDGESIRK